MKKFICEFCGREFKNSLAVWGHLSHCKKRLELIKKNQLNINKKNIKMKNDEEKILIQKHLYEINGRLGEIAGLLRRIKETLELMSISKTNKEFESSN